jgi:hypothetical protein
MAKKGKAPPWRGRFLHALARGANVRLAARQAGVDHSSAYGLRRRDADFARRWEVALAKGLARVAAGEAPLDFARDERRGSRDASELVVRRSKTGGAKLVRAGAGRWNAAAEERFFAELGRTACAEWAAEAAGFSTTALYNRRRNYPDFAERWRIAEEEETARLHRFVVSAGIASFDPTAAWEGAPKVSVAEAISILRLKGSGASAGPGRGKGLGDFREPSIEEVRANILRKLDATEAAERRDAGSED